MHYVRLPAGKYGAVECKNRTYPDTPVYLAPVALYSVATASGDSPWQYAAHTTMHEYNHVQDFMTYAPNGGCAPYEDEVFARHITGAGFDVDHNGVIALSEYEAFNDQRTLNDYERLLGVPSPRASNYDPLMHPEHRAVPSCPFSN